MNGCPASRVQCFVKDVRRKGFLEVGPLAKQRCCIPHFFLCVCVCVYECVCMCMCVWVDGQRAGWGVVFLCMCVCLTIMYVCMPPSFSLRSFLGSFPRSLMSVCARACVPWPFSVSPCLFYPSRPWPQAAARFLPQPDHSHLHCGGHAGCHPQHAAPGEARLPGYHHG